MPNGDLARVEHAELSTLDQGPGRQLSAQDVRAQVNLIQEIMKSVMQGPSPENPEGVHYGTIPGCGDKPTLKQPGSQKLMLAFRLIPRRDVEIRELGEGHREVRVKTMLYSPDGEYRGEGFGTCSTLESKYRYRNAARKCPNCGAETIIKGKQEFGGGWLCYAKRGGCGSKWPAGAPEIEAQDQGKIPNPDPADTWNTVEKMACKRADVHATISTLAASDIFTQDIEDDPAAYAQNAEEAEKKAAQKQEAEAKKKAKAAPKTDEDKALENGPLGGKFRVLHALVKAVGRDHSWLHEAAGRQYGATSMAELKAEQLDEMIAVLQDELKAKGEGA